MIKDEYLVSVEFADGSVEKVDKEIFELLTTNVIDWPNDEESYFGRDELTGKMADVVDVEIDGITYTVNIYHVADIENGDYKIYEADGQILE